MANPESKRKSIPEEVKFILRNEVGFGCPVQGCGNPYLEYHHFDPPVHVTAHNNPEGMIALCAQHHKKADGGVYTIEQLHEFKNDKANAENVRGNLDWLRKDILAIIGGAFYYETPKIIVIDGYEVISLKRDKDGYLRLTINMLSILSEERVIINENSWENIGNPIDLRSPPQGKELEVKYHNGDYVYLKFSEITAAEELIKKYKINSYDFFEEINYPITAVEVNLKIGGTNIELTPEKTSILGLAINGGIISNCGCGIVFDGTKINWMQNPKWKIYSKIEFIENEKIIHVNFKKRT